MVNYVIEGKIAVIIGCSKDETEVVIPEFIENVPVGKVGEGAFTEMPKLRKVVFPKTVKLISSYAFAECRNLSEVIFSEGLEVIEDWAFISCNIEEITLPNSIKSIGENAFMGNAVKQDVVAFMDRKQSNKKVVIPSKKNAAVFPMELLESMENLTTDLITERANYYYNQLTNVDIGILKSSDLDVPYIFDGSDFLVAVTTHMGLKDPRIELATDSLAKIGKYEDNDPDFLTLRLNVISSDGPIGDFVVKAPYLEEANFTVVDVYSIEETTNRFFLHVSANLGCYGSGNISREFAFNQLDELDGKYLSQLRNDLISKEVYDDLHSQLNDVAHDTIKTFFKQVSGAPVLEFLMAVFEQMLKDETLEEGLVEQFIYTRIDAIYHYLSDYKTFENVCFDMKPTTQFLTEHLGYSLEDIKNKYGLAIVDDEGKKLSIAEIAEYRKSLEDNEDNYNLHAQYLDYLYQMMNKLNQEFSMKEYQE